MNLFRGQKVKADKYCHRQCTIGITIFLKLVLVLVWGGSIVVRALDLQP